MQIADVAFQQIRRSIEFIAMKRTINLLALAAAMAVFAVSVEAQKQECTEENKNA